MPAFQLTVKSIAGNAISGLGYIHLAYFEADVHSSPKVTPVSVSPIGGFDRYARAQPQGKAFPVHINLATTNQADVDNLKQILDPYKGIQTMVLTDGNGVDRSVSVKSRGMMAIDVLNYLADLWAFDPLMYANIATTLVATIDADSKNVVLTNAGDTRTRNMTMDMIVPNPKESELYKFRWARQAIVVNRSSKAMVNWPVELTNGGWDTTSLIRDTSFATTINGAVTNVQNTIPLVSTAGLSPSGMIFVTDGGANDEQISYALISGNTLQGCTRGIGGTTGVAHSGGQTVNRARMLKNGNDVRVYVDGIEADRFFGTSTSQINAGATRLWVPLDIQPETLTCTVGTAMTAGVPATGGTLKVTTGQSTAGFPNVGALCIDSEVITYSGRTATGFTGLARGARNTTAAAHTESATIYHVQHSIIVCYGWAGADAPPTDAAKLPVFSLAAAESSNTQYEWRAFGNVFKTQVRPADWYPTLTQDDPLYAYTSNVNMLTALQFKDALPTAGAPNANGAQINLPFPIDNVASAIVSDVTQNPVYSVNYYGRDIDGNESLLTSYTGAGTLTANAINSVGLMYALRIAALHTIVTGVPVGQADTSSQTITNNTYMQSTSGAQTFTLDKTSKITSIACHAKAIGAADTMFCQIFKVVLANQPIPGGGFGPYPYDVIDLTHAMSEELAFGSVSSASYVLTQASFTNPPVLPPGFYFLEWRSGTANTLQISYANGLYARGSNYNTSGSFWFELYGQDPITGLPIPQAEASAKTASVVTVDNLIIKMQASTAPLVLFQAVQDTVMMADTLTNPSTGQVLTFSGPFPLPVQGGAGFRTLHIDCSSGLVTVTETGELVGWLVASSDNVGFFGLDPGTNICVYGSSGYGTCTTKPALTITYRSAWT